jgi:DNA-binding NtrC family response regulator
MMQGKLPRQVLVVDDEALIRWSVSEALADAGWRVQQAATGAEARAAVDRLLGAPFVVLLDLRLPDVADLSLMQDLRTRRPDVPVVIMTAHGTPEQARAAWDAGVYRVVDKPFDIGTVVRLLDEAYTAAAWPEDASSS